MDDILMTLLPMMEYEQNLSRRLAYSECLNKILEKTKISIARWSPKILRIIDDYSKTSDTELPAMNVTIYLFNRSYLYPFPFPPS